jgi:hypothetical protein
VQNFALSVKMVTFYELQIEARRESNNKPFSALTLVYGSMYLRSNANNSMELSR